MVEYAWRQPDGEIAPVLQTEGYDLMVKIFGNWVRVVDLVKSARRLVILIKGTEVNHDPQA